MNTLHKVLLVLLLCLAVTLNAQESETDLEDQVFGVILYADGEGLSIFREGELLSYSIYEDDIIGLPLLEGDMVQTEDNSFVEIQMLPSESIIKVAENTTFEITTLPEEGGGSFQLLYGRVRARVTGLSDDAGFSIRGRSTLAGVRGTDFGFDYVVNQDSFLPSTSVYCFEGSVAVQEIDEDGSESAAEANSELLLAAMEMVDFQSEAETPEPPGKTAIRQEISEYWTANSLKSRALRISEVETRFPDIKQKLALAREAAALAAEKRGFLASGRTLQEFRELQQARLLENPPPRDVYPLIEPVNMISLIPEIETEIYNPNALRITGAVMGVLGSFLEAGGLVLTFLGDDLGIDPSISESYGPVLIASGSVSLLSAFLALILDSGR